MSHSGPLLSHYLAAPLTTVFYSAVVLIVLKALVRLCRGTYVFFLRSGVSLERYGPWAVITGATDGIGRAYAAALADKGLNVVLLSRSESKLSEFASQIRNSYHVEVKYLAVDFTDTTALTWRAVAELLGTVDVGLLINNVGISYDHKEYFDEFDDNSVEAMITVNICATTRMTKLMLPTMKRRKRSAIVNIGSFAATAAPVAPFYAVYAATKAYVDSFSKSLNLEYAAYGISVQNQAPGYVATKMSKIRQPALYAPSPSIWARQAVKHIGYEATSCPYWFHGVIWFLYNSLPACVVVPYIYHHHLLMRQKHFNALSLQQKSS